MRCDARGAGCEVNAANRPGRVFLPRASLVNPCASRAFLLIDCLVYIALLFVLLALAFLAFYRSLDNSKGLHRGAADMARALNAGERWRADVRAATSPPRLEQTGTETVLRLPRGPGDVLYTFRAGAVLRKDTGRARSEWMPFLPEVKSSRMSSEPRQRVAAWRWELELASRSQAPRVKPLFTFQAVPATERKP
jgi:hypothetical protein